MMKRNTWLVLAAGLSLLACGGGGGGGGTTTYEVRTSVTGLTGGNSVVLAGSFGGAAATEVTVSADGDVADLTRNVAEGTTYEITIRTQPSVGACLVSNGSGTMGTTPVLVQVNCSDQTFTIGGAIAGLGSASGLVLRNSAGSEALNVPPGATSYVFANAIPAGTAYTVSVQASPQNISCTVANPTGTLTGNVTNADVSCSAAVAQRWDAPTTWGGLWPDEASMVQHAYFNATGIVEAKGFNWTAQPGAPGLRELTGLPRGSRFGAGPFNANQRFEASGDSAVAALTGPITVCAVVKPDYNAAAQTDKAIIARGSAPGATSLGFAGIPVVARPRAAGCSRRPAPTSPSTTPTSPPATAATCATRPRSPPTSPTRPPVPPAPRPRWRRSPTPAR